MTIDSSPRALRSYAIGLCLLFSVGALLPACHERASDAGSKDCPPFEGCPNTKPGSVCGESPPPPCADVGSEYLCIDGAWEFQNAGAACRPDAGDDAGDDGGF